MQKTGGRRPMIDVFLRKELLPFGRRDCTCVKIFSGANFLKSPISATAELLFYFNMSPRL